MRGLILAISFAFLAIQAYSEPSDSWRRLIWELWIQSPHWTTWHEHAWWSDRRFQREPERLTRTSIGWRWTVWSGWRMGAGAQALGRWDGSPGSTAGRSQSPVKPGQRLLSCFLSKEFWISVKPLTCNDLGQILQSTTAPAIQPAHALYLPGIDNTAWWCGRTQEWQFHFSPKNNPHF